MKINKTILILVLSILLITIGILLIINVPKEKENVKEITITKHIIGKEINNNRGLNSEHCMDNICISQMIIYKEKEGNIQVLGILNNKGKNINNKTININFIYNDEKTITLKYKIKELKKQEQIKLQLKSNNEELLQVVDYDIK